MRDDILEYTHKVNEKFGGADVPHFSIGNSMGGAVQILIASHEPETFKGITLLCPYIGLDEVTKANLAKAKSIAKVLHYIAPEYRMSMPVPPNELSWMANWRQDPLVESYKICAHNLLLIDEITESMFTEYAAKIQTPFLLLLGEADIVVCNKLAKEFFEQTKSEDKTLFEYKGLAHHGMMQDNAFSPAIVEQTLAWFDARL